MLYWANICLYCYPQVYIAAHVPPGVFELAPTFKWFHEDLNTEYLDVIDNYGEMIVAQFYGHEHTDSFRVYDSISEYNCISISELRV